MDLTDFKVIQTFPDYLVNEYGVVFSTLSHKILTQRIRNASGYLFVSMLTKDKVSKNVAINRLVAHVYLNMDELYNNFEVDHIDRNILNNHYSNLQVLTKEQHTIKTINDNNLTKRDKKYCTVCNIKIDYRATVCLLHHVPDQPKNPNLTKDEIKESVSLYGWIEAARKYNLSDNGLRKNYKRLGGDPSKLRKNK